MRNILKNINDLTESAEEKFDSREIIRALDPEAVDAEGEEAEFLERLGDRIYQSFPDTVSYNDMLEILREPDFQRFRPMVDDNFLAFVLRASGLDENASGGIAGVAQPLKTQEGDEILSAAEILEMIEQEYDLVPTASNPSAAYDAIEEWLQHHNLMDRYDEVSAVYDGRDEVYESTDIKEALSELEFWLAFQEPSSGGSLTDLANYGINEIANKYGVSAETLVAVFQKTHNLDPVSWIEHNEIDGSPENQAFDEDDTDDMQDIVRMMEIARYQL